MDSNEYNLLPCYCFHSVSTFMKYSNGLFKIDTNCLRTHIIFIGDMVTCSIRLREIFHTLSYISNQLSQTTKYKLSHQKHLEYIHNLPIFIPLCQLKVTLRDLM